MNTTEKITKLENSIHMETAKKLWIHCNCCYDFFIDKKNIFFMLACQHVICEKCVTATMGHTPVDAPVFMCPICQKRVRGRQVSNSLPTTLKDMFHPEPWTDGLPYDRVYKFQADNHKSLVANINKGVNTYLLLSAEMRVTPKSFCCFCRKNRKKNLIKICSWQRNCVQNVIWNSVVFARNENSSKFV